MVHLARDSISPRAARMDDARGRIQATEGGELTSDFRRDELLALRNEIESEEEWLGAFADANEVTDGFTRKFIERLAVDHGVDVAVEVFNLLSRGKLRTAIEAFKHSDLVARIRVDQLAIADRFRPRTPATSPCRSPLRRRRMASSSPVTSLTNVNGMCEPTM
jgi:hypothetical protein